MKNGLGIWILSLMVMILAAEGCGPSMAASTPSPEQHMEFETLKGQIADQQRSAKTRFEAARILLGKDSPQADELLTQFLTDSSNPGAQLAVAEAIAVADGGEKSFVDPLLEILTGSEPSIRSAAARALVTYQAPDVVDKIIAVARNRKIELAIRLETIRAFQNVISRRYFPVLIDLLSDPDSAVRNAAANSLAKLTNNRMLGTNRKAWQKWWDDNKRKSQTEWLTELAERLTRSKMKLESENSQIRERLVKANQDIYDSSVKEQKQEILLQLLKDPLSDIRLLGVTLADRRLAANEQIAPLVRQSIRILLDDENPRIRQAVAILEANLGDPGTDKLLLGRLKVEQLPSVRVGLLTALGQLKAPHAMPAVLNAIRSINNEEATAAAGALARLVEAKPLEGGEKTQPAQVLIKRYTQAMAGQNAQTLREALLRAMGVVGDPAATDILVGALKDPAGVIRLAAVNGLTRLGANGSAGEIAKLAGDPDRGVRQAAILALTTLGKTEFIKTILERTDPKIESDPAVRKQAFEGVLAFCQKADLAKLESVTAMLQEQATADDLEIQILYLYIDALRQAGSGSAKIPEALRNLGQTLLSAGRAGEAVPVFEELYELAKRNKSPQGKQAVNKAWLAYVSALLDADSTTVAGVMMTQQDKDTFSRALRLFHSRIASLMQKKSYLPAILLIEALLAEKNGPLTASQRGPLRKKLAEIRQDQLAVDRETIEQLLPDMLSQDISKKTDADAKVKAMGSRAGRPLLEQLKKAVTTQPADVNAEQVILDMLKQIAPTPGNYNISDPKDQKLKQINGWLNEN